MDIPTETQNVSEIRLAYGAITTNAALVDRRLWGRLKLTGEDSLDLLNRLTTNDLTGLSSEGQGIATVLTSNKGRIIDILTVLYINDGLTVITSPQNQHAVAEWINFYTIMDDVSIEDETPETSMISIIGPNAGGFLDELMNQPLPQMPEFSHYNVQIQDIDTRLIRADFSGIPKYDLITSVESSERLKALLLKQGKHSQIELVNEESLELIRVLQGIPAFGKELTRERNPLEANLHRFISFNKDCYIGQEVIARLNTYQKVQRQLVGLSWKTSEGTESEEFFNANKQIGAVTSKVGIPWLDKTIGLGYVRISHSDPGNVLVTGSENDEFKATVEKLPFRL